MNMEINRELYVVKAYHFDKQVPDVEVKTDISIGITPIVAPKNANYPKAGSILGVDLQFSLPLADYVISGKISQINHILNRKIEKQTDLQPQEVKELVAPLLDVVQRLTYDVTEIALDKPGITLNFTSQLE